MKKSTPAAAVSVAAALTLSACGALSESSPSEEQSGSNAPTSNQMDESADEDADDVDAEEADVEAEDLEDDSESADEGDGTHEFGETASYPDGLSITVSEPKDYTPSSTSFGSEGYPNSVQFTVKIVNKTGNSFDPSLLYASIQSGNTEGEQIFDSAKGMEGAPSTTVLDGRESTFPIAFGVQDPTDLVLEINTGDWERDSTIFVKEGS